MCQEIKKIAYPQPDFQRAQWLNLNGTWDFSLNNTNYDAKIQVPYPWGSPLSGFGDSSAGVGHYRRVVRWNPDGDRIFLVFGAVDYLCTVRCNGTELGTHRGGYSRFEFEVTDLWNREGDNLLEVDTKDLWVEMNMDLSGYSEEDAAMLRSQTNGKQQYGDARGIWQTPWLETRSSAYISSFFVRTKLDGTVSYEVECADAPDGSLVTACFGSVSASAPVSGGKALVTFTVPEPRWWCPDDPYLYEGALTLSSAGKEDTVSTYFGIREIGTGKFGPDRLNCITLNGKPCFLNGVLDQSYNPKGYFTLPSDEECRKEILRLKRIGINMTRIHIKAEEPLKLYWADKLGLLVMEDMPNFWGPIDQQTRDQYEIEMSREILRDRNHPAIIYWVLFNETWGLMERTQDTEGKDKYVYRPETAAWVAGCVRKAHSLDDTRLVEDNSECNRDHTITDVNTWHFYSNGYENVRAEVNRFCNDAYPGSTGNFKDGYSMPDIPCMNSECGNVWGIQGSSGCSDLSWQYKYMINEFRRHGLLNGFVFTEFHDVINEFNGYYKLNNDEKDFGYEAYGSSLRDLHSQDYLGADFAPMTSVRPGDTVTVPLFGSSYTDVRHGKLLNVVWQLTCVDPVGGDFIADNGDFGLVWAGYGAFPAGQITLDIPEHDGVAILSFGLYDGEERIMQNFLHFDVLGRREQVLALAPSQFAGSFSKVIPTAMGKVSGLGAGSFTAQIRTAEVPGLDKASDLRILLEAATRETMTHDLDGAEATAQRMAYNRSMGYQGDPSANPNAFEMTDLQKHPGFLEISIDGAACAEIYLPDCPADSRGALSHHYQPADDRLEEAGSYGELCDISVPVDVLLKIQQQKSFELTFTMKDDAGLSLFSRTSGRYGLGIVLAAR